MDKPTRVQRTPTRERLEREQVRKREKQKPDFSDVMRRLIAVLVIVIALGAAIYLTGSIVQLLNIDETLAVNKLTAQTAAKGFVREVMLEPGTVSFGSADAQPAGDNVEELGGGVFDCSGWVEASTNQGDRIRARFNCRVQGEEDAAWELVQPVSITEPPDTHGSIVRGSD